MDRVLIVDDDEFVRTGLAADLLHGGFRVEVAASCSEGLAVLSEFDPDLVLLDIRIDQEDGVTFLEQIRGTHPRLPVVMISGNATLASTIGALRAGATDFVTKPIDPEELVHRVRRAIDSQRDRVLAEQAERIQDKLESLQTLAGGIAHDLNNQLTVILGCAQEMTQASENGLDRGQMTTAIQHSGEVIARLAEKLLVYSGGGLFEVEPVDLTVLVTTRIQALAQRLRVSLNSAATIELEAPPDTLTVAMDQPQMERVLEGVLYNAFEATNGSGGTVRIELAARCVDETLLRGDPRLASLRPGSYARIRISDTGSGMSAETLRNIFDPFFTTKFTGRGMGLAAALGVVRAHQGHLLIDSKEGAGTVVECYLPLQEPVSARRATPVGFPAEASEEEAAPPAGHVLIIDDEAPIRTMVTRVLEKAGLQVTASPDGATGLRVLAERPEGFDLVMLDLTMPGMDGVEVLREIRTMRSDAQVLLISGYHSKDVIDRFVDDQPDAFLQKPFDVQGLREKVCRMVRNARSG